MRNETPWRAVALAMAMAAGCDPAPAPEYLPVGGGDVIEFDRGTFMSSNDSVLTVTTRDTSAKVCPGISLLGCPGSERTALRTEVTLQAIAEGEAELRGKTEEEPEIVQAYKVERIQALEVRTVHPSMNGDLGTRLPEEEDLTVAAGSSVVVQINALGDSKIPLGNVEPFYLIVDDETVASVNFGRASRGWRATVKGLVAGSTTLSVLTEWATRDVAIRVQ